MTSKEINKDTIPVMGEYDVIVVGAGHAGCEAGLISARMGMNTLLLCINLESVAMMPCNPSIGRNGKGTLGVRNRCAWRRDGIEHRQNLPSEQDAEYLQGSCGTLPSGTGR